MTDRIHGLGRKINHDPRSRAYRVTGSAPRTTIRWERKSPVLDQGNLGSCTGNAGTGLLGTVPVIQPNTDPASLNEAFAVALYSDASKIDSDPDNYPPVDSGSDGLSVAKVLKSRGLISGYVHAFGIEDAFTAIHNGPFMVGTNWYTRMSSPGPTGLVIASGQIEGGHEYECIGYDSVSDLWEFVNSWSTDWGVAGRFFYSTTTLTKLLSEQGDITQLVPLSEPAPTPTPTPVPVDADAALWAVAKTWAGQRHTGTGAKVARALTAWAKSKSLS